MILSTTGFGPVTKPSRIPELRILEKESNLENIHCTSELKSKILEKESNLENIYFRTYE